MNKVYFELPLSEYIQNPWHYSKAWSQTGHHWPPLVKFTMLTPPQYNILLYLGLMMLAKNRKKCKTGFLQHTTTSHL